MTPRQKLTAVGTVFRKEVGKIFRIPVQTLIAPIVTTLLFFIVIGGILGTKIGTVYGASFVDFAVPGVILLAVIVNTFVHVAKNIFMARKVHNNMEEIAVSPMPAWLISSGFAAAGMVRGFLVGAVVLFVSHFFDPISIAHPIVAFTFVVCTALAMASFGVVAGLLSSNLENISTANTFLITPATYIGGVFHSTLFLPPLAAAISAWNPVFYLINGFRYGFIGAADTSITQSSIALALITATAIGAAYICARIRAGLVR